jgi:hypothetical protein
VDNLTYTLEVTDSKLKNRFNIRSTIYGGRYTDEMVELLKYQVEKNAEQMRREVADKYGEVADAAAQLLVHMLGDPTRWGSVGIRFPAEQHSPALRRLHEALYKMGVPEAQKYSFTTLYDQYRGLTNP